MDDIAIPTLRFENALEPGQIANGFDRLYVPKVGYVTGDLDIHDVAVEADGRAVFVNTLFGCLATISDRHSFVPLWKPPFLSKLAAEDRCHLNGLAMEAGRAAYVTSVSQSDVADGWRDRRRDGGCVIDVRTNQIIVSGLSMPHSPRVYRNQLWLLDSGTGHFGRVDRDTGKFEPLTFCPGYLRGLSFIGDYAVVGLSQCRENRVDVSDNSGGAVSGAGDVNSDGFDDLLIGTDVGDAAGNTKSGAGESYLVFGKADWSASPTLDLATLNDTNGVTLFGVDATDFSGHSVSGGGDVNGFDDLLIGAFFGDAAGNAKTTAGDSECPSEIEFERRGVEGDLRKKPRR